MQPFAGQFTLPRLERVIAGPGSAAALAGELDSYGCQRVLIVTGGTLAASPLTARLAAGLGARCAGVFSGARQHVPRRTVDALVRALAGAGADGVVSFGGGSPIDTAKAAVHARLRSDGTPLIHIALPTTLSAGEFTDVAGVTDEATRIKHAIADVRLAPRTVIADPELCAETPGWLWAASGIRALDHAIESLYSRRRHPITEAVAPRAIEMLLAHLPASMSAGEEARLAHRGECQMAAWLAVFGVTNAGFGLSHVLGHQIGPRWDVAHGVTSAIMLPHAMRFMARRVPERFAFIARSFGIAYDPRSPAEAALACADRTEAFIAQFSLPARLADVGVEGQGIDAIAEHVQAVMARDAPLGTPVAREDLVALLTAAC